MEGLMQNWHDNAAAEVNSIEEAIFSEHAQHQ